MRSQLDKLIRKRRSDSSVPDEPWGSVFHKSASQSVFAPITVAPRAASKGSTMLPALGAHAPLWQVSPPVQALPQAPQLLGSAVVSTQAPPQSV
jgi:hypothetical protein